MRTMTIQEIKQLEPGEIIPSFCGTIDAVKKTASGSSEYGPWTVQNIRIKDKTGSIGVAVWNRSNDFTQKDIGRELVLSSVNGKHGIQGVKKGKDEEYNGKRYPRVETTKTADLDFVDRRVESEDPEEGQENEQERHQEAPEPQTTSQDPQEALERFKGALSRKAHALKLCLETARTLVSEPEDVRSVAIHLAIGLERQFASDNIPPLPVSTHLAQPSLPAIQKPRPQTGPSAAPSQKEEDEDDSGVPF